MVREPFVIAEQQIKPGEHKTVRLPVATMYTHTPMELPIHVFHGKEDGPVVFVTAAIHGDEINGVEIIRRLHKLKALKRISGTLITVPIVNIYGFIQQSRYLPDRRDLNRVFPGSQRGSLAARLADLILNKIVKHCTHGIDLHTGALHRSNLPQIRFTKGNDEAYELAKAFNVPVIMHATVRDGSLREAAANLGIPMLLYEAGEALRFDEISIRVGLRGITNILVKLGMIDIPQRKQRREAKDSRMAKSSLWVRAPISGMVHQPKRLGNMVKKGKILAKIVDPFGAIEHKVLAPFDGVIIGKSNLPLVNEGDAVFHLAGFEDMGQILGHLDDLQAEMTLAPQPLIDPIGS